MFPPARRYPSPPAPTLGVLTVDRQIFRMDGEPWQWLGCSAFPLCHVYETQGAAEVDAFLDAYPGIRVVRVWDYVGSGWGAQAWNSSPPAVWVAFVQHCNARGVLVECTLLTDDDTARIEPAKRLAAALSSAGVSAVLEAGNEPTTHKSIDTAALRHALESSDLPYSSGDYEDTHRWYGTFGTYHPARTSDFARRAHDAYEYFHGGGPNRPDEPACPVSWVNDEPAKLQDVPPGWPAWRSHIAATFLFGGGFTLHSETGKFCQLPTNDERTLWALACEVRGQIAADAALGAYRRIVEGPQGQTEGGRTYVVGNYLVRCQQNGTTCPEPGWTPLDTVGVLFTR